ncbi:hypothetical protein N7457_007555 [Penicillium paradoxum]|uniref:uncharacterized protein n=1 Tax=Penicillium paradoxum TaxID=176176 RepID=UPI0025486C5E|nr:uncharacterized protein N7457_007555 [Penicillium paradoxum]KAJ5779835.1 hypothetical protein N7457_007555 [Penicillium paradoxum]
MEPPNARSPPSSTEASHQPTTPGSCALRLENLEEKSSATKRELMESIAADICATFISIAKHSEAGTLLATHTDVIDKVILTIHDTDVGQRRILEKRGRRLRKERNWIRRRHLKVATEADALARAYKARMRVLQSSLRKAREEADQLRSERDILRAFMKRNAAEERTTDDDADGEYETDTMEGGDGL